MADLMMIDEDDDSVSQSLRLDRRGRETSPRLSVSPSAKVALPPTPITNPEKFGIKVHKREGERYKMDGAYNKHAGATTNGTTTNLISPTASSTSNDTGKHLV